MTAGLLTRTASLLLGLALAGTALSARAETAILVDAGTGAVLAQKDATQRWYPASTTKLMTTYVALEMIRNGEAAADTPVVMTRRAADEPPSKMGYEPGSVMRLDNALRMIMVKSANDVSVAIAQALGGRDREAFGRYIERMNDTAARLGMKDSHFVNPHGLPAPGQFSSAKDLAILAVALRRDFPSESDLFRIEALFTGTDTIPNHNDLLGRYPGTDGMKTGYICASGFNVVTTATRDGRTLVAVVLGANSVIQRAKETAELLEKGFAQSVPEEAQLLASLPASSGPPADVSKEICSKEARTARANEQKLADKTPDTPYLTPLVRKTTRAPQVVQVGLGGAAGFGDIKPGVTLIPAYGIPLPTPRPTWPPVPTAVSPAAAADEGAIGDAPAQGRVVSAEPAPAAQP